MTNQDRLNLIFKRPFSLEKNFIVFADSAIDNNQNQTNEVFSDKWIRYEKSMEKERAYEFQRKWYLSLYGFESVEALQKHLRKCELIFDCGCGLGYKAAWFAELAPHALVIGMDFSDAARQAAVIYSDVPNLIFVKGDIAHTGMHSGIVDYVNCDQVIMHTENPDLTFRELARVCKRAEGQIACYFYTKKSLPRELLDDYFRIACRNMSSDELWEMSEQITELGRRLADLKVTFIAPDIPALGIKQGEYDIQRFIYWNFLKCFWNPELGKETSIATNFDWYSPSNAQRFSEKEVRDLMATAKVVDIFFHAEEACFSGRFKHKQ